ncbi:hypothetical protein B0H12DRAFT_219640 [Mycena haematopus]|nr:hypothetical protein B0H12DRAFT_219640 [Mycena haematopus]
MVTLALLLASPVSLPFLHELRTRTSPFRLPDDLTQETTVRREHGDLPVLFLSRYSDFVGVPRLARFLCVAGGSEATMDRSARAASTRANCLPPWRAARITYLARAFPLYVRSLAVPEWL